MKDRNHIIKASIIVLTFIFAISSKAQVPAFTSAEGFGKFATGGRGGQVVFVTTTEDYTTGETPIEGSLRWALSQHPEEPITVIFRTSGIIKLKEELKCARNGYTLAGQTAPGDGICIRGAKVNLGGSKNVIIRHLRFRIGLKDDGTHTDGGSIGIENCEDVIVDHCTFGWSCEENMTMYDNKRTTVQWCIIHEGLYSAGHIKGSRSYATQWGGDFSSYHHNLLAHCHNRMPRFNGARDDRETNDYKILTDYVNNVIYNWGKANSCYGGDITKGEKNEINMVGNYYKPGLARPAKSKSYFVQASYGGDSYRKVGQWYASGNIMEGNDSFTTDNALGIDKSAYPTDLQEQVIVETPFEIKTPYQIKTETASDAFKSVLAKAGAHPLDEVDRRIIDETENGTASGYGTSEFESETKTSRYYQKTLGIIDDPAAVGGYPEYSTYGNITDNDNDGMDDIWETENGLNPEDPSDRNKITDSGYTALEAYLAHLAGEYIPLDFTEGIVSSFKNETLTIFPNPTSDRLFIGTERKLEEARIYSSEGKLISVLPLYQCAIVDVSHLPTGNYLMILIDSEKEQNSVRFIKK